MGPIKLLIDTCDNKESKILFKIQRSQLAGGRPAVKHDPDKIKPISVKS